MRIPNIYALVILALFPVAYLASPQVFGPLWQHGAAFALVLFVTFAMFWAGMLGGGDTKFAAAVSLWIGLKFIVVFLFYMAIVGGILGGLSLWLRKARPVAAPREKSWIARAQSGESVVPYGIAISVGTWISFFHTGYFNQLKDELFKIIH